MTYAAQRRNRAEIRRRQMLIERLEEERSSLDDSITAHVATMRDMGASWTDVGTALGISKQAAQKRYDRRLPL